MKFWVAVVLGAVLFAVGITATLLWQTGSKSTHKEIVVAAKPSDAAEGKSPKLVFENRKHEVGSIPQFHEGTTVFEVQNDGEAVLKLRRGEISCSCAGAHIRVPGDDEELASLDLQPGESCEFVIDWDTKTRFGKFVVSAALQSNDPLQATVAFEVHLDVKLGVLADPTTVAFGRLRRGQTATKSVYFFSQIHDDLEILSADTGCDYIRAEIKPITKEKLAQLNGTSGAEVEVTLVADDPSIGSFVQRLTVETNSEETKQRMIDLHGTIVGSFEMVPSRLDFNVVSNDADRSREVKVFAHDLAEGQSLVVGEVKPEMLHATIRHDTEFPTLWRLEVTAPKGSPAGPFTGTVQIDDNFGNNHLTLDVAGTVADSLKTAANR